MELHLDEISETFIFMNLLCHDFLHDFDVVNQAKRLERLQKKVTSFQQDIESPNPSLNQTGGISRKVYDSIKDYIENNKPEDDYSKFTENIISLTNKLKDASYNLLSVWTPEIDDDYYIKFIDVINDFEIRTTGHATRQTTQKTLKLVNTFINDFILKLYGYYNDEIKFRDSISDDAAAAAAPVAPAAAAAADPVAPAPAPAAKSQTWFNWLYSLIFYSNTSSGGNRNNYNTEPYNTEPYNTEPYNTEPYNTEPYNTEFYDAYSELISGKALDNNEFIYKIKIDHNYIEVVSGTQITSDKIKELFKKFQNLIQHHNISNGVQFKQFKELLEKFLDHTSNRNRILLSPEDKEECLNMIKPYKELIGGLIRFRPEGQTKDYARDEWMRAKAKDITEVSALKYVKNLTQKGIREEEKINNINSEKLEKVKNMFGENIENEIYINNILSANQTYKAILLEEPNITEEQREIYLRFINNFEFVFTILTLKYDKVDSFKILNSMLLKRLMMIYTIFGIEKNSVNVLNNILFKVMFKDEEQKIITIQKGGDGEEDKSGNSLYIKIINDEKEVLKKFQGIIQEIKTEGDDPSRLPNIKNQVNTNIIKVIEEDIIEKRKKITQEDISGDNFYFLNEAQIKDISKNIQIFKSNLKINIYKLQEQIEKDISNNVFTSTQQKEGNRILASLNKIKFNLITEGVEIPTQQTGQRTSSRTSVKQRILIGIEERVKQIEEIKDQIQDILIKLENYITYINKKVDLNIIKFEKLIKKQQLLMSSGKFSPENKKTLNNINKTYVIGLLQLMDYIKYEPNEGLLLTENFKKIIRNIKKDNVFSQLLVLQMFILFNDKFTSIQLWEQSLEFKGVKGIFEEYTFENMLDEALINGVKKILNKHNIIRYEKAKEIPKITTLQRFIVNNAANDLQYFEATQADNVMCPIPSVIDAMPNCNFSDTKIGKNNICNFFYPNNIQFKMFGTKNTYFGKISNPTGKLNDINFTSTKNCNESIKQNGFKDDSLIVPQYVSYTIQLVFYQKRRFYVS